MDERAPRDRDAPAPEASATPAAQDAAAPDGSGVRVEYDAPPAYPGYAYPPAPAAYAPPGYEPAAIHAPPYADAPPQRSGAASAIGTLGIIFGALALLWAVVRIGVSALGQALQDRLAAAGPTSRLFQLDMGIWGLMALLSIALIVVGVGVWRHREMARKAMLVWALAALLTVAGRMAAEALVIQPESFKQIDPQGEMQRADKEQVLRIGRSVGLALTFLVWAPYPLVALLLLTRRTVRDRFC